MVQQQVASFVSLSFIVRHGQDWYFSMPLDTRVGVSVPAVPVYFDIMHLPQCGVNLVDGAFLLHCCSELLD